MENLPQEGLWTYTYSLTSTHLAAAVGALVEARQFRLSDADVNRSERERLKAVSVILHSYSALDAALSLIGHYLFANPESKKFILPQNRDVGMEMLAKGWFRTVPVVDKLRFIVMRSSRSMPARLESQLRELANLRNYLAHGFVYNTIVLLSKTEVENQFVTVDEESSFDWAARFPNTKFKRMDRLQCADGILAFRIVLECLREIAAATGDIFFGMNYYSKTSKAFLIMENSDISEIIEEQVGRTANNDVS